ncbi:uncharacterized protein DS421_3g98360 [Arachis hypogaea]|nr:uncharacterized protein DS421_3g98360 [Arachis hypogaea]
MLPSRARKPSTSTVTALAAASASNPYQRCRHGFVFSGGWVDAPPPSAFISWACLWKYGILVRGFGMWPNLRGEGACDLDDNSVACKLPLLADDGIDGVMESVELTEVLRGGSVRGGGVGWFLQIHVMPCKTQAAIGEGRKPANETCPACRQEQCLTNFGLRKTQDAFAIINLLPRKLDPPDTFNEVAASTLALTGFQHVSRAGEMRGHSALPSALVERWRPETHTFHLPVGEVTVTLDDPGLNDHVLGKVNIAWVRQCRDTEPCDTQESLERYVRAHIFCVLDTIVFPDKSTVSLNSKFLPLLRDFPRISGYSWGAASLAHLYRSLCRASQYNCKKMDGPLILLFVWAWERMPFLAPIPRDQLGNIGGVIGADIRDIYGGLLHILGEDSTTWELTT